MKMSVFKDPTAHRPKNFYLGFEPIEVKDVMSYKVIHRGTSVITYEPTEEAIKYAEENRIITEQILLNRILQKNSTHIKRFLEEVIKTSNEPMYVNFYNNFYGKTNAGTQSGIVTNDKNYKRSETKNPNWIDVYQTGRFTPIKDKRHKRVKQHHLVEMLVSKMKLSINEALMLDKALSKINEKDEDSNRYSADTGGSYNKLTSETKKRYFEEFIYNDSDGKKFVGYKVKDDEDIKNIIKLYVIEMEYLAKPEGINKDPNTYLKVDVLDYFKMSLYAQLHILRNLEYIENFTIYIKLQHKQDIANQGRRYNILNEIPREDRNQIKNLFGLDMETALQVIVNHKVRELDPSIELPLTEYYIANKKSSRIYMASRIIGGTVEEAKMEITAIYQGRKYNPKRTEWHKEAKELFDERDLIRSTIFKTRNDKTDASKYAKARTEKRLEKINQDDKSMNTYMFFYWTYFEREIQNIIADKIKYPITLHDAVYTQDKSEFENINIKELEKEILDLTGIEINLD